MATTEQQPAAAQNGTSAGIPVENPATGEIITTVPSLSAAEVREVVARARAAQPAWNELGFAERSKIFMRAQKWITENADRIIDVIVSETGKTYEDAQLAEISHGAAAFGFWAKHAEEFLADERVKSSNVLVAGKKLIVRHAPVGVVGVIGPWNFPLTNSFGDCIPALAAGNTVVLKPSEVTPLTSLLMVEMLRECGLPQNVFQVATGAGETGAALAGEVDFIMFTGSTATGKKIAAKAAESLTPYSLELGGKDPMIVCSDADIERAANAAAFYSMNNGGQVCISIERAYVEADVYDDFVARVSKKVGALRQGESTGPGTVDVGAVTHPPQIDIVDSHVQDAVAKGAKVLTGGKASNSARGRFYEPTVLVDVDHSMSCMTEETFGPTLPIMKVANVEEAMALANDSVYGLAASVWTKDVVKGEALARQVQAGAVCVNDAQVFYTAMEVPMGGWKTSGIGTRHGAGGIRKFTKPQTLMVTRLAMKKDVHMFPYKPRTTRLLGKLVKLLYGRGKRA